MAQFANNDVFDLHNRIHSQLNFRYNEFHKLTLHNMRVYEANIFRIILLENGLHEKYETKMHLVKILQ